MIINGATGTGVKREVCPSLVMPGMGVSLSRPDILLQVYKDYIGAGAQLIIDTF